MQLIRSKVEADTVADIAIRKLILERIAEIADDIPFSDVHGYFVLVEVGDTLEASPPLPGISRFAHSTRDPRNAQ